MKKIVLISILSLLFFIQCSAIRQHAMEAHQKNEEQYEKYESGERPFMEVDFNGYIETMMYCFDNYKDEVARKYINWYPSYHSQLLKSFDYGAYINLFSESTQYEKDKYAEFGEWYEKLME